ncbi:MAG: type II toxin-antitoxin system RelE/ParE family toxin [Christensenellaceae bacterium]|jgi:mRNA-degrading endonuclease RelE of RelBE toxin-antitoxin system|nr:type II toxin-antitoxin system RelE/ParE family toxin [Christensenellaceae bacterium]
MANEEKTYKITIAPTANDRMAEHFAFLAQVSADAANRLLDELMEDILSLQKMPYRNPIYERPYVQHGKYRCLISTKRYRIVYQIEGDTVFVDDIHDSRQSDDKDMLNLGQRP